MAPKKTQLGYIQCNVARRASFKKRRQGLLKKVQELSKLCDVPACAIVYSEDPSEQPVHWPENHGEMEQVLFKLRSCPERNRKTMNQESYIDERVQKYTQQLRKVRRKNHDAEMHHLMQLIYLYGKSQGEFTTAELKSLRGYAEEKVKELQRRAEFLAQGGTAPGPPDAAGSPPPSPPPPPPPSMVVARDDARLKGMGAQNGASGDFQGFPHNKTLWQGEAIAGGRAVIKEEVELPVPEPHTSGGGRAGGNRATWGYPQGNFEIGGSSGTNRAAVDAAIIGRGVLVPLRRILASQGGDAGRYGRLNAAFSSGTHGCVITPYQRGSFGGYVYAMAPFGIVGGGTDNRFGLRLPHGYVAVATGGQNGMQGGIGGHNGLVAAPSNAVAGGPGDSPMMTPVALP